MELGCGGRGAGGRAGAPSVWCGAVLALPRLPTHVVAAEPLPLSAQWCPNLPSSRRRLPSPHYELHGPGAVRVGPPRVCSRGGGWTGRAGAPRSPTLFAPGRLGAPVPPPPPPDTGRGGERGPGRESAAPAASPCSGGGARLWRACDARREPPCRPQRCRARPAARCRHCRSAGLAAGGRGGGGGRRAAPRRVVARPCKVRACSCLPCPRPPPTPSRT